MTKMLASVTGPEEAAIALAGGADVIDLKDPGMGSLGAVAPSTVRQTVSLVAGRRPVSAVCGDLPMDPAVIAARVTEMAGAGVDYVKVGFFPSHTATECARSLQASAKAVKIVAVLFADREPDVALLPVLAKNGFHGVMLDTADKAGGRLLDHFPPERIASFVEAAKSHGLETGLSGSLEPPDVPRLLPFAPDILGFRSALCTGARRQASIDPEAVALIRSLIPEERSGRESGKVDYRLLAARGYSPDSADATLKTNRIFVRDFILPVAIGAYGFEHGHTQQVKFDVVADVLRTVSNPEDMRHVFSYDVITDGIRMIVAKGHIQLAEALAEQIAALVLQDQRVMRVQVKVEKLEVGPGAVGVEIERTRRELISAARSGGLSENGNAQASPGKKGFMP